MRPSPAGRGTSERKAYGTNEKAGFRPASSLVRTSRLDQPGGGELSFRVSMICSGSSATATRGGRARRGAPAGATSGSATGAAFARVSTISRPESGGSVMATGGNGSVGRGGGATAACVGTRGSGTARGGVYATASTAAGAAMRSASIVRGDDDGGDVSPSGRCVTSTTGASVAGGGGALPWSAPDSACPLRS